MSFFLGFLLCAVAVFLILLVLVQRGRGGGLAGALGGAGGSSAFGAKAGDVFTKITSITAGLWIALCTFSVWYLSSTDRTDVSTRATAPGTSAISAPDDETAGGAAETTPDGGATPPADE